MGAAASVQKEEYFPFKFEFALIRPVDSKGVIAFANLTVQEFQGKKALVECDDEKWLVVSADAILAEVL